MRVYTASGIAKFRPGHPGQSKFRSPWYEGPGEPIHHRVITYYDHPIITDERIKFVTKFSYQRITPGRPRSYFKFINRTTVAVL